MSRASHQGTRGTAQSAGASYQETKMVLSSKKLDKVHRGLRSRIASYPGSIDRAHKGICAKLLIRYEKQQKDGVREGDMQIPDPASDDFKKLLLSLASPKEIVTTYFKLQNVDLNVYERMSETCEQWGDDDVDIQNDEEDGYGMDEEQQRILINERKESLIDYVAKTMVPVKVFFTSSGRDPIQSFLGWYFCDYGALHLGIKIGHITLEWGMPGKLGTSVIIPELEEKIESSIVGILDTVSKEEASDSRKQAIDNVVDNILQNTGPNAVHSGSQGHRGITEAMHQSVGDVRRLGMVEKAKFYKVAKVVARYNQKYVWGKFRSRNIKNCQAFVTDCMKVLGLQIERKGEIEKFLERVESNSNDQRLFLRGKEIQSRMDLYKIVEEVGWENFASYDKNYVLSLIDVMNERVKMFEYARTHEQFLITAFQVANHVAKAGSARYAAGSIAVGSTTVAVGGSTAALSVAFPPAGIVALGIGSTGIAVLGAGIVAAGVIATLKAYEYAKKLKKLVDDLVKAKENPDETVLHVLRKKIQETLFVLILVWNELGRSLDGEKVKNWAKIWEERREKAKSGVRRIVSAFEEESEGETET